MLENIVELKSNKKFKENKRKTNKLFYVDNNTKMTNKKNHKLNGEFLT